MIRPNFVGSKVLYNNPSSVSFTTADVALIDEGLDTSLCSPYAYTATVRDDIDSINYRLPAAGVDLLTIQQVSMGLFLSPDNEKNNLLFQVSGAANIIVNGSTSFHSSFFFGRKATNNTVSSTKAGVANTLDKFILLPTSRANTLNSATTISLVGDSIEKEILSIYSSGAYVYCFGFIIRNYSGSTITMKGSIDLSFRKYQSEIGVFRPSR